MKIVGEYLSDGKIVVIPQDSDDLYHLYNTIVEGDKIEAKTSRKIKRTDGVDDTNRITVFMRLKVDEIEFHGFGESIRIRGIIEEASDDSISYGSYHSITIELYKKLTIYKDEWKRADLERLRSAQMGESSPLVVVAMDDQGAIISQVGSHASKILLEMEPSIPRKGSDPQQHQQATQEFFRDLAEFLHMQREEGVAEYIVIGGPGFTKDNFSNYLKRNHSTLAENMQTVDSNSAGRTGVREIITHHIPQNFVAGQNASQQAQLVEQVLEEIGKDTEKIAYGKNIEKAVKLGAIDKLLVLDSKMRESIETRKHIDELIEQTKEMGGKVITISSMHDSGDIIEGLGGLVALLRFSLP